MNAFDKSQQSALRTFISQCLAYDKSHDNAALKEAEGFFSKSQLAFVKDILKGFSDEERGSTQIKTVNIFWKEDFPSHDDNEFCVQLRKVSVEDLVNKNFFNEDTFLEPNEVIVDCDEYPFAAELNDFGVDLDENNFFEVAEGAFPNENCKLTVHDDGWSDSVIEDPDNFYVPSHFDKLKAKYDSLDLTIKKFLSIKSIPQQEQGEKFDLARSVLIYPSGEISETVFARCAKNEIAGCGDLYEVPFDALHPMILADPRNMIFECHGDMHGRYLSDEDRLQLAKDLDMEDEFNQAKSKLVWLVNDVENRHDEAEDLICRM